MVLEFIGADREVTGSCHYLTFGDTHILIDCGMEQGADLYVNPSRGLGDVYKRQHIYLLTVEWSRELICT